MINTIEVNIKHSTVTGEVPVGMGGEQKVIHFEVVFEGLSGDFSLIASNFHQLL